MSDVVEVRGAGRGPRLALLGGVHGDEDEGTLAVRLLLARLRTAGFGGSVVAAAPANPAAWQANARLTPSDGKNLARCFPGAQDGSETDELAAGLTQRVIRGADLLVDLHSAGAHYAMPLMTGYVASSPGADVAAAAAAQFAAPLTWVHPTGSPGRSLAAAAALGVPALYAECGGGRQVRGEELDAYVHGLLRVMRWLGMVEAAPAPAPVPRQVVHGTGDLDQGLAADHDGVLVTRCRAGDTVGEGDRLGEVYDLDGRLLRTLVAPRPATVLFLRRTARHRAGDVLAVLAGPARPLLAASSAQRAQGAPDAGDER
jgi:predicted deacylase